MPSKAVTVRFAEKEYERLGGNARRLDVSHVCMQDAEKSSAEIRRNCEKALGDGLLVAVHEEHIRAFGNLRRFFESAPLRTSCR